MESDDEMKDVAVEEEEEQEFEVPEGVENDKGSFKVRISNGELILTKWIYCSL